MFILWVVSLKFCNEGEDTVFFGNSLELRGSDLDCQTDFLHIQIVS
jgi:hypothetical protein